MPVRLLFLLLVPTLVLGDDARASVADLVARDHKEHVQPDTDPHGDQQDTVLISPVGASHVPPGRHDQAAHDPHHHPRPERFQVIDVQFHHVSTPFIISLWIIIAGLAKIAFHLAPKVSKLCPESCQLIVVGVLIGLLLYYTGLTTVGPLTPDLFFLFMLPPIVLDAGYYMPNRAFFDNLGTIIMYAVVGTVWNTMTIGVSLWAVGLTGLFGKTMPVMETFLFSAIISAVDPVAVLAVFEEIHVNEVLHILVFGESLLNDGVTVVLYRMFEGFASMNEIIAVDYVAGIASFFVVALGGTLMGIVWGLLGAFISRFTHHVLIIEPLFVFVMSYLSYLSAELFTLSGILALTFCGITMKNYVEENISYKSHITVKYVMKMMANTSETIIFIFLGVSTVNDIHEWNTWFVVLTIVFCSVYRAMGVGLQTALVNMFRVHKLNRVDQFIMSYGGLRGAVAFALVLVISEDVIPSKRMMVTTVISVVYFTVFIQGMTIGPLVKLLNVPRSNKTKPGMGERIHTRLMDHTMAGIEDIIGRRMGSYHLRDKFKFYNNKYLRPLFTRESHLKEPKILETASRLNLADAMNLVQQNGAMVPAFSSEKGLSLSTLLRTYTQANFGKTLPQSWTMDPMEGGQEESNPPHLNYDLGELQYSPSNRDMADAELHHILEDAMFKPENRFRRYSRTDIFEGAAHHPPFQHQIRRQIRQMVSQQNRQKKKSRRQKKPNGNVPQQANGSSRTGKNILRFKMPSMSPGPHIPDTLSPLGSLTSIQEDEGITFTARHTEEASPPDTRITIQADAEDGEDPRTLTEKTLPWKRDDDDDDDGSGNGSVRPQQEFPSWIDNKDYMVYQSPSATILDQLGTAQGRRPPGIFEIFELNPGQRQEALNARRTSHDGVVTPRRPDDPSPEPDHDQEQSIRL